MLLITEIRREGRRYAVVCGEELTVTLDSDTLDSSGLEPGDEVEEARLMELADRSMYKQARDRALYTVGRKEICREGLIRQLTRGECSREIAGRVADEMIELGFINDVRYANMLADYLYREKRYGSRRVIMELTSKGVDRELAAAAAEENAYDPEEALDALLESRFGRELDTPAGVRRAMNNLLRYGYAPGEIRSAIERKTRQSFDEDF